MASLYFQVSHFLKSKALTKLSVAISPLMGNCLLVVAMTKRLLNALFWETILFTVFLSQPILLKFALNVVT